VTGQGRGEATDADGRFGSAGEIGGCDLRAAVRGALTVVAVGPPVGAGLTEGELAAFWLGVGRQRAAVTAVVGDALGLGAGAEHGAGGAVGCPEDFPVVVGRLLGPDVTVRLRLVDGPMVFALLTWRDRRVAVDGPIAGGWHVGALFGPARESGYQTVVSDVAAAVRAAGALLGVPMTQGPATAGG
jgi:hypothetical protein